MKYNIGDTVPIATVLRITGAQTRKDGQAVYQTDREFVIQEHILDQITLNGRPGNVDKPDVTVTMNGKPIKPDKPTYKAGDKAVIIGNNNRHCYENGDVVTLVSQEKSASGVCFWWTGRNSGYVMESDITPYTEPTASKPTEQPDKVMLYCIKDYGDGSSVARGEIFTKDSSGHICGERGWRSAWPISEMRNLDGFFIPLVKRPAKVGEWVYVTSTCCNSLRTQNSAGNLMLAASVECDGRIFDKDGYTMHYMEDGTGYLVLDGYEPEPECFNGKVVCVENSHGSECFYTVGKVYAFKNGEMISDKGSNPFVRKVKNFEDLSNVTAAKFIPLID